MHSANMTHTVDGNPILARKISTFRSCSWISLQPKVEGLVLFQFWVEILKKLDTQALLAVVSKIAPIWCRDAYVYIK